MQYQLWYLEDSDGGSYTLLPADADDSTRRVNIEPGAILLITIEAASFEDAIRQQHEFLGWEPYKPPRV